MAIDYRGPSAPILICLCNRLSFSQTFSSLSFTRRRRNLFPTGNLEHKRIKTEFRNRCGLANHTFSWLESLRMRSHAVSSLSSQLSCHAEMCHSSMTSYDLIILHCLGERQKRKEKHKIFCTTNFALRKFTISSSKHQQIAFDFSANRKTNQK